MRKIPEVPELPVIERLRWLAERARAIRKPDTKWTKKETERSWRAWDEEAQRLIIDVQKRGA